MPRKRSKHYRISNLHYALLAEIANYRRHVLRVYESSIQHVLDDAIAEYLANHALTTRQQKELLNRVLGGFNTKGK